jgi:LysM repeat protein
MKERGSRFAAAARFPRDATAEYQRRVCRRMRQAAPIEQAAVVPQAREPLGAPLPTAVPPAPTAAIKFSSKPIEPSYTVAANDNLWSIAQRNRTTAEAIQAINNLPERATLHIGQRLVMP